MINKRMTLYTFLAGTILVAAVAASASMFKNVKTISLAEDGYYHYAAYDGGCTGYSVKEYWTTCKGETTITNPGGTALEERTLTAEQVAEIVKNNQSDERLFIKGHDLGANDLCRNCHEYAMTKIVVDTYPTGGAKGGATLTEDTTYSADGYGKMYKYAHTYNDGTTKFAISSIFKTTSLEGISKIQFKIVVPESRLLLAGNDSTNYEIYASKDSTISNPVPTVITLLRDGNTDDWTMTDSAGVLRKYGGDVVASASLPKRTTFDGLFHNFTNWGVSFVYISDVMATITKETITNDAIVTGESGGKTYTLAESSTVVSGFDKVYSYSCTSYFRAMFTDISIEEFKIIEFYYDGSGSNDQITFKYGESYFGFHKGAGNVTGYLKAYNLGSGSWKLIGSDGLMFRLSNGTKVTELSYEGCTKLNELLCVTGDGWANTPIKISDILVTK